MKRGALIQMLIDAQSTLNQKSTHIERSPKTYVDRFTIKIIIGNGSSETDVD